MTRGIDSEIYFLKCDIRNLESSLRVNTDSIYKKKLEEQLFNKKVELANLENEKKRK